MKIGVGVILFIPRTVAKHKLQLLPKKLCAILHLLKDRVILFIPRTVAKHKIQLLPNKLCAILNLFKDRVANPHPIM